MQVQVFTLTDTIPIKRDVREDNISAKLFTSVIEDVLKTLDWNDKGVNINGV